jgi:hypothetical protein
MKKLLVIGGILVGLGIVGVIVTAFFLGNIVTAGVNRFAPQITQTTVVLSGASISPLSGSGTLSGLVVGNPKGWSDANLCSLGKIHLEVQPFSILGDHVIINEISIEAPEFNYETKIVASNVGDLLKTIGEISGSAAAPQATTKTGKPIKFEVKKFHLQNGWVRVGVGPAALKLPMPPVELDDIGTAQGGITPDQLAFAVMRSVTPSIIAATTQAAGKLIPTAGSAALEGIKGLFGGDKKKP